MKQKVKAFTLTEIVIVLVISTIVAGMAFSVLRIVQQNINGISQNYEEKTSMLQIKQSLTIDFNTFRTIWWDAENSRLHLESPIQKKTYHFYPEKLIADSITYNIPLQSKKLYWQGVEVSAGRIDAVVLNFSKKGNQKRIFISQPEDLKVQFLKKEVYGN